MRLLICLVLFACPLSAMAVYKCETGKAGGAERSVTYSDTPCPSGKSTAIDPASNTVSVVHESADSRLAQQKEELRRLEHGRHQREMQEDKASQKRARAYAARQKKCARLAQQQKWREEDAAMSAGKTTHRAQLKARRAAETYQLECG